MPSSIPKLFEYFGDLNTILEKRSRKNYDDNKAIIVIAPDVFVGLPVSPRIYGESYSLTEINHRTLQPYCFRDQGGTGKTLKPSTI